LNLQLKTRLDLTCDTPFNFDEFCVTSRAPMRLRWGYRRLWAWTPWPLDGFKGQQPLSPCPSKRSLVKTSPPTHSIKYHLRRHQPITASIRPGSPLGKRAAERTCEFTVGILAASRHTKAPGQRNPVDHRMREISEGPRLGSGLGDTGAGKLGLQSAVAAVCAHHDGHVRAFAGYRPERLQGVKTASDNLECDDAPVRAYERSAQPTLPASAAMSEVSGASNARWRVA